MKPTRWIELLVFALLTSSLCAQPTDPSAESIRTVVYNVQFLPSVAQIANRRSQPEYRADKIAEALSEFDIIGLNEVFDLPMRERMLAKFRSLMGDDLSVVVSPPRLRSPFGVDSGLMLVSRYRLVRSAAMAFGNDSTIAQYGWGADGFAAKGVIHGRLEIPRQDPSGTTFPIDVFVTHLESKDDRRRRQQYKMLADFISQHADRGNPVLLLGDLNTDGGGQARETPESGYQALKTELQRVHPKFTDIWLKSGRGPAGTGRPEEVEGGRRIDYVWFGIGERADSAGQVAPTLRVESAKTAKYPDPKVKYLSDHCAVTATLRVEAP